MMLAFESAMTRMTITAMKLEAFILCQPICECLSLLLSDAEEYE